MVGNLSKIHKQKYSLHTQKLIKNIMYTLDRLYNSERLNVTYIDDYAHVNFKITKKHDENYQNLFIKKCNLGENTHARIEIYDAMYQCRHIVWKQLYFETLNPLYICTCAEVTLNMPNINIHDECYVCVIFKNMTNMNNTEFMNSCDGTQIVYSTRTKELPVFANVTSGNKRKLEDDNCEYTTQHTTKHAKTEAVNFITHV